MQIDGLWQLLIRQNKTKQDQKAAYHIPVIENERTDIKSWSDDLFTQPFTKRVKTGHDLSISEYSLNPQQMDTNRSCFFTLNKLSMRADLCDFLPLTFHCGSFQTYSKFERIFQWRFNALGTWTSHAGLPSIYLSNSILDQSSASSLSHLTEPQHHACY